MIKYTSNAEWPDGAISQARANNKTTDYHQSKEAADAVCNMLERDGLGGEGRGKDLPIENMDWI